MQHKAHPRTPLERRGQVNWRVPASLPDVIITPKDLLCQFVVTQRKGWGSTGPTQSMSLSPAGVDRALSIFPPDKYYRYKVNVYLKGRNHVSRS